MCCVPGPDFQSCDGSNTTNDCLRASQPNFDCWSHSSGRKDVSGNMWGEHLRSWCTTVVLLRAKLHHLPRVVTACCCTGKGLAIYSLYFRQKVHVVVDCLLPAAPWGDLEISEGTNMAGATFCGASSGAEFPSFYLAIVKSASEVQSGMETLC